MKTLSLAVLSIVSFMLFGVYIINERSDYTHIRQVSYGIGDQNEIFCSSTKISEYQLLTAAHCVPFSEDETSTESYIFTIYDDSSKTIVGKAKLIRIDREKDLALLWITEGVKGSYASVASQEPSRDDRVMAVGYPLGYVEVATEGLLQSLECLPGIECTYWHSAPTTYGNSGGGLWIQDWWGRWFLVGVTNRITGQGYGPYNSLGLAIPLQDIKEFLK